MHFRLPSALRLFAVALFPVFSFNFQLSAQRPPAQPNAAEILHRMQKLNVLGSVLYIVAHPDDENTRLIAWLANGKKVRTGNLSLTRGDGGQNLIGPELGDALGIIRTQELLEARRIDGGEQFFTRAVDFGYSKNAAESFEKWGKQEVLSDVVRVIRMFRPDIIITRFAPDRSAGHGHHEASAILAEAAFDLAGDPKAFPEQLQQGLEVWQPRRLFFNGSTWWKKDLAEIAKNDPSWFTVDVGGYDPLLGLSYTEIAGRSRSMHKSQGFGAAETRGEMLEYLKFIKGDRPKTKDIFEGIDMTWGRVNNGEGVKRSIEVLVSTFNPLASAQSLTRLNEVHRALQQLDSSYWKGPISFEVRELAADIAGLVIEPLMTEPFTSSRQSTNVPVSMISRNNLPVELKGRLKHVEGFPESSSVDLKEGEVVSLNGRFRHENQPYWLKSSPFHEIGSWWGYTLPTWRGEQSVEVEGTIGEVDVYQEVPILYKWVDRVAGERIRPVYVTPVASVIPKTEVLIARGGPQTITVEVEALTDSLTGDLQIELPDYWTISNHRQKTTGVNADVTQRPPLRFEENINSGDLDIKVAVDLHRKQDRIMFEFVLEPLEKAREGRLRFSLVSPKGTSDRTLHEIDYPHIMPQVYYTPAEVKLVPLEVKTTAKRVGYVKGAGDDVPQALEQLGVVVEFIEPASAKLEELKKYDAIVTGIRAYNATKGMKELHPLLLQYVEQGGTLIVQYNTTPRFSVSGVEDFQIDPATLGPHPFKITRDRVTVEEAPPTFLDPKHPLLTIPNAITAADFEGWVQERGLYFAGELGDKYTPLIAWSDPGEQPLNGGLITCDYGKGRFIYTGISFFRQLPAGVPGAYRLFANLISKRE